MPTDETTRKWILDNYKAGYTPEQLRASLSQTGRDPTAVNEVLGLPLGPKPLPPVVQEAPPKKSVNWGLVLVVLSLAAMILGLILFSRLINNLIFGALGAQGVPLG